MMNLNDNFTANLRNFPGDRQLGVSGMMRVKNDAEFIELCIESCIKALDELVIVYNECSDDSPIILQQMAQKYPDKIKLYEYKPKIYAWNLTESQINGIFDRSIPPENTLAGYYNFALSKTTKSFVMKIDADQIYHTQKLKEICDCYRTSNTNIKISVLDKFTIFVVRSYKYVCSKLGFSSVFLNNKRIFNRYKKVVYKLVKKYKINVSLSGVNVYINNDATFVTKGKNTDTGCNILNPYNGEGDHLIFKVTPDTYFIPALDKAYTIANGLKTSVIETLRGTGRLWPIGLFWIHLNSCRIKNIASTKENFIKYPDCFMKLEEFSNKPLNKFYFNIEKSSIYWYRINNLGLIHNSLDSTFTNFVENWKNKILQNLKQGKVTNY